MKRGPVEVVVDIAKADPGTADFLAEALLYEALCDEIDRVRPFLERDGARYVAKRAEGALQEIAKRYPTARGEEKAELEALAEQLALTLTVAKASGEAAVTEDDPKTPWWDARDAGGHFASRRGRYTAHAVDALSLMTGNSQKSKQVQDRAGQHLNAIAQGDRYSRARALGTALTRTGNPHLAAAGHLTRLAGEIGPEASRVFGRGLTRLSYRYRGTERRPDENVAGMSRQVAAATAGNDQARLTALNKLGVDALSRYLPQMDLARLSLESGQLPPSRGIMFDAQGHAVTEAVGVNGDHYLPFDLKNLKRLRGGQYVRTRATGGLTDEDIYTGLLAGARQVTVVSNSGVFSVEFDPALRGGRRYSDKARSMVGRYSSLLERINQGDLIRDDVPAKEQAKLRRDAYERAKGNETLGKEYFDEDLRKERLKRRFQTKDDDELQAEAEAKAREQMAGQNVRGEVKGVSGRTLAQRQKDIFRDLQTEQREQMVRNYRLDGEGYRDAQRALHQEFPFFVRRTQFIPLDEYLLDGRLAPDAALPPRVGADIGYTRRNQLRPGEGRSRQDRSDEDKAKETAAKPKGPDSGGGGAEAGWAAEYAPDSGLHTELSLLLGKSLAVRPRFGANMLQAEKGVGEQEARGMGAEEWADWVLKAKGGTTGTARFLLDPKTDIEHLKRAKEALEILRDDKDTPSEYDKFDEAVDFVNAQLRSRQPFADKSTGDLVLAKPSTDNPAPPPIPEIYNLGDSLKAITAYAEKDPDVASLAQASLESNDGDEGLVQNIRNDLAKVDTINRWPDGDSGLAEEDHPPANGVTHTMVNDWKHGNPKDTELYKRLETQQKAWALARAAEVAAWRQQVGVPKLGPKAEEAETAAKRAPLPPRLVLHRPSELAKRLQPSRPRR